MRTRIGIRLILGAGLVTATVIGGMAFAILRSQTAQLMAERTRSADQLSETIKSATHFDMLENRRENLYAQIRKISALRREGIQKVRIFNKEGRIVYSTRPETGRMVDKNTEACFVCHTREQPLVRVDVPSRARTFRATSAVAADKWSGVRGRPFVSR